MYRLIKEGERTGEEKERKGIEGEIWRWNGVEGEKVHEDKERR